MTKKEFLQRVNPHNIKNVKFYIVLNNGVIHSSFNDEEMAKGVAENIDNRSIDSELNSDDFTSFDDLKDLDDGTCIISINIPVNTADIDNSTYVTPEGYEISYNDIYNAYASIESEDDILGSIDDIDDIEDDDDEHSLF